MSTRTKFNGRMSFAPNPLEFEMNFWIKFAFCLLLAICSFALTGSAEACEGRVAGAVLRPVRTLNRVRVNRLEARAARGNKLAAARTEATHARMSSRCN